MTFDIGQLADDAIQSAVSTHWALSFGVMRRGYVSRGRDGSRNGRTPASAGATDRSAVKSSPSRRRPGQSHSAIR